MRNTKVIIVGGGLAGLVSAIDLSRNGVECHVIEKHEYPFHRVCGEYISNEVVPYLKSLEAFPQLIGPSSIRNFQLTSVNGKSVNMPLDLGGFGISRYQFDQFLYNRAKELGVSFSLNTEAENISSVEEGFTVKTSDENYYADLVIGAFGKRSKLDVNLSRNFIKKRSPYVGVKYHIKLSDFPDDLIALHNFKNGYCGISHVENKVINLCYLTQRDNLKKYGNIPSMEKAVLFQNPFLKKIFMEAEFLFTKPETINEISFETKGPVEDHILMAGDAAGMITPLCGNGMAIAIHTAKILSRHIFHFDRNINYTRSQLENDYSKTWNTLFSNRLRTGRVIQNLFGDTWTSNVAVNMARFTPSIANFLMSKTHGIPF